MNTMGTFARVGSAAVVRLLLVRIEKRTYSA